MKKILFLVSVFSFIALIAQASVPSSANPISAKSNSSYFNFENELVSAEMTELNTLENYVLNNEGTTYSQLSSEKNDLVSNTASVNGLGVENALQKGDGMPTWAIVLIIVGGVLLLLLAVCCLLGLAGSSAQ